MAIEEERKMLREDLEELSPSVIDRLKNQGMTQSEIARMYDVTRQYISWIKYYHGGRMTPREEVLQHFPFVVPTELTQTSPYRRLRDHGEFMATGGVGMSDDKLKRLRAFYAKLRDEGLVVEYDPETPPIPGESNKGGWAFRKRLKSDGDLLIRVNEYTHLTDRGLMIWRFPPRDP
jgi:transcriptional regulator with XRE-family HTH domain